MEKKRKQQRERRNVNNQDEGSLKRLQSCGRGCQIRKVRADVGVTARTTPVKNALIIYMYSCCLVQPEREIKGVAIRRRATLTIRILSLLSWVLSHQPVSFTSDDYTVHYQCQQKASQWSSLSQSMVETSSAVVPTLLLILLVFFMSPVVGMGSLFI